MEFERVWKNVSSTGGTTGAFKVMQFNVLADSLSGQRTDNGGFENLDGVLNWDKRKLRLKNEIIKYDPDIICLEEIDHFSDYFERELEVLHYSGVFKKKPKAESKDGCAVFFRDTMFEHVKTDVLNYDNAGKGQLALILLLRRKIEKDTIRVIATHLKAQKDSEGESIRCAQIKSLLNYLDTDTEDSCECPTIIACDLNGTPKGTLSYPSLAYPAVMNHSHFKSAYCISWNNHSVSEELPFTTWKIRGEKESKHTIDYIFYTFRNLNVQSILTIPDNVGPFPRNSYPSDHFALVASFYFSSFEQ